MSAFTRLLGAGCVCAMLAGMPGLAGVAQTRPGDPRMRPPEGLACAANDLTSFTGRVVRYARTKDQTTLRIRTDWETTERVVVRHPGNDDPTPWFRFAGQPFAHSDWGRIEERRGLLRPGTRATAWVCKDRSVVVDWQQQ